MKNTINIIGWSNGGGLSRDIEILRGVLVEWGYRVFVNGQFDGQMRVPYIARAVNRVYRSRFGKAAVVRAGLKPPFELNVHLEDIRGDRLWLAKRNVLIPNQEWFREWCRPFLPHIDEVWVKTRVAQHLFSQLGTRVRFLGWSSADRKIPGLMGARTVTGLHVAGASTIKGTQTLLDVWNRHPEWPLLRVVRRMRAYGGGSLPSLQWLPASNIRVITDRVEDQALLRMQNESAIYVCPSEAEGFGHVILEGMSVGAVVITTDAPPMNELVTADAGLLVAADRSEPMGLGKRYYVNSVELEKAIGAALTMTETDREALGQAARARFEAMNDAFRERLRVCLNAFVGAPDEQSGVTSVRSIC